MTPQVDSAGEPEDVEDRAEEFDVDRPVPIACQWGVPAWCSTGRHHRCYFTTNAEEIKNGTYGHHDGHVWVCPCHAHQGYPPRPHPDHLGTGVRPVAALPVGNVQQNLF